MDPLSCKSKRVRVVCMSFTVTKELANLVLLPICLPPTPKENGIGHGCSKRPISPRNVGSEEKGKEREKGEQWRLREELNQ